MLSGLPYVQSHIVDNLLFCSLDPYLLGRGVAKSSEFSILGSRENLVENPGPSFRWFQKMWRPLVELLFT